MQDGQAEGAAGQGPSVEAAHEALLADPRYQFEPDVFVPEPSEPRERSWLERLFEGEGWEAFFLFLGKLLQLVFWLGLAAVAAAILYAAGRAGLQAWQRRAPKEERDAPEAYAPAPAVARTLLEDAARLAAKGRYGDAVRLILRRSIEDMERQRPGAVRDAMTSREIARLPILGPKGKAGFGRIAGLVEAAHFAGRALSLAEYEEARTTYEGLARGGLA